MVVFFSSFSSELNRVLICYSSSSWTTRAYTQTHTRARLPTARKKHPTKQNAQKSIGCVGKRVKEWMMVDMSMPASPKKTDAIAQTSNRKLNRKISLYCTYSPLYALLSIISKYGKCIVYIEESWGLILCSVCVRVCVNEPAWACLCSCPCACMFVCACVHECAPMWCVPSFGIFQLKRMREKRKQISPVYINMYVYTLAPTYIYYSVNTRTHTITIYR